MYTTKQNASLSVMDFQENFWFLETFLQDQNDLDVMEFVWKNSCMPCGWRHENQNMLRRKRVSRAAASLFALYTHNYGYIQWPRQQFWEHFHNLLWTFQLFLLVQKRNSWSVIKCYKGYLLLLGNNSDCSELNLNILVVESFKGILHFKKGLIGKLFKIALWINLEFPFEMPDWRGCSTSIWTSRGTSVQTKHKVGSSWLNQRDILGCQIEALPFFDSRCWIRVTVWMKWRLQVEQRPRYIGPIKGRVALLHTNLANQNPIILRTVNWTLCLE